VIRGAREGNHPDRGFRIGSDRKHPGRDDVTTTRKWLSVQETADRLGVSPSLVYQWCHERTLPHLRLGKAGRRGKILIDEADLDAFIAASRVEAGQGTAPSSRTRVSDLFEGAI
jgi:excisionase family DNA binding protein